MADAASIANFGRRLANSHPRNGEAFEIGPVRPHQRLVHRHPKAAGFALIFRPVGLNGFAEALDFLLTGIGWTRIEMFRPLAPLSWKIKDSRFRLMHACSPLCCSDPGATRKDRGQPGRCRQETGSQEGSNRCAIGT